MGNQPLTRGMHSYHASLGAFNHSKLQQQAPSQSQAQTGPGHKSANSMNMQWMTHKTTFSQYTQANEAKFKMAERNSVFDHSDNTFSMIPRRSISAPSSPKIHLNPLTLQRDSSLMDSLDLGDDDHEEEEEEEEQRDVLDDTDHSPLAGDESTVSED